MTIQRTWANGRVSMPVDAAGKTMLTASDAAKLDGALQSAVDKSYRNTTIAGKLTIGAGGAISLDSDTASLVVGTSTQVHTFGGKIVLGDNDFYEFATPRSRTVGATFLEGFINFANSFGVPSTLSSGNIFPAGVSPTWSWYVDNGTAALKSGTSLSSTGSAALFIPLSRMHDKASNLTLNAYFAVDSARTQLPTRYPGINLLRVDPFLGTCVSIGGWKYFPTPANLAAYKNGATSGCNGNANVITVTSSVEAVSVDVYQYVLVLLDEDLPVADTNVPNAYTGFSVTMGTIHNLAFQ